MVENRIITQEVRRIQVVGDSALITLPKSWARTNGFFEQKSALLTIIDDGSLIVQPYVGETNAMH